MAKPFSALLSIIDRWEYRATQRPGSEGRAVKECAAELREWIAEGLAAFCESVRAEEALVSAASRDSNAVQPASEPPNAPETHGAEASEANAPARGGEKP